MQKYLYVNGCSYTAGDNLKLEETWPFKLGELLGVRNVMNKAVNGNSMFAISHTTFHHLEQLSPENIYVVIGMTWKGRKGFLFDNSTINITPADLAKEKPYYKDKISTNRRSCAVHALDNNHRIKNKMWADWIKNDELENTAQLYTDHYKKLIENDPHLDRNLDLEYKYYLSMLENYLISRGFNYMFVDFQQYYLTKKFLNFKIEDNPTLHPTAEDCTKIAEFLYRKFTDE